MTIIEILVLGHIAIAFLVTIVLSFIFGWDGETDGVGPSIIVIAALWPLALTSAVVGWLAHKLSDRLQQG